MAERFIFVEELMKLRVYTKELEEKMSKALSRIEQGVLSAEPIKYVFPWSISDNPIAVAKALVHIFDGYKDVDRGVIWLHTYIPPERFLHAFLHEFCHDRVFELVFYGDAERYKRAYDEVWDAVKQSLGPGAKPEEIHKRHPEENACESFAKMLETEILMHCRQEVEELKKIVEWFYLATKDAIYRAAESLDKAKEVIELYITDEHIKRLREAAEKLGRCIDEKAWRAVERHIDILTFLVRDMYSAFGVEV